MLRTKTGDSEFKERDRGNKHNFGITGRFPERTCCGKDSASGGRRPLRDVSGYKQEATIANVDFVSIAPEGFVHKDKFIELKLKIELRVKFRELYDFIKILETRHKLFLVQELKFETNDALYPSGIALLKAVTYLRKKE